MTGHVLLDSFVYQRHLEAPPPEHRGLGTWHPMVHGDIASSVAATVEHCRPLETGAGSSRGCCSGERLRPVEVGLLDDLIVWYRLRDEIERETGGAFVY